MHHFCSQYILFCSLLFLSRCTLIVALIATVSIAINNNDPDNNNTGTNNETLIDLMVLLRVPFDKATYNVESENLNKCKNALEAGIVALLKRENFENDSTTLDRDSPR